MELVLFFWCLILTMVILIQADKMDDMREWVRNLSRKITDLETSRITKGDFDRKMNRVEREMENLKRKLNDK